MDLAAPVAPWAFEVVGPLVWLGLAAWYVRQCRREGRLTVPALVFVGATTMWWQEWYGDWGGYVLYNPHLHLIPGYHLPFTSPNKPWAVLPAYGWFYGLVYLPLIALVRRRSSPPADGFVLRAVVVPHVDTRRLPRWAVLLGTGFVAYYLWDLLIEGVASVWGLWSYTQHVGPVLASTRGSFPLVYPIVPFALMMAVTAVVIDATTRDGIPWVEHVARAEGRPVRRVLAWVVAMNLCYGVLFIGPIVLVRWAFLPPGSLVP